MPELVAANVTGLFSYGKQSTVELGNQGLIQLTGINYDRLTQDANGSGKSSLFNAICHILYGECPVKGATDTTILNKVWDNGYWGMLKFRGKNNNLYRLVISRKWKGEYPDASSETDPCDTHEQGHRVDGTDVYLHEWRDGKWYDIRSAKSAETRTDAIRKFGLSYKQFLTTSYLAQQTGLLLVTGTNKERMAIVTELTQMGVWDRAVDLLRERLKQKSQVVAEANAKISGLQSALSMVPPEIPAEEIILLQSQLVSNTAAIQHGRDFIASTEAALTNKRLTRTNLYADLLNARQERNSTTDRVSKVMAELASLRATRNSLVPAQPKIDMKLEMEPVSIAAGIQALKAQMSGMMSGAGKCPRCASIVTADHIEAERRLLEAQISNLTVSYNNALSAVTKARAEASDIATQEYNAKIAQLDAEISTKLIVPSTVTIDLRIKEAEALVAAIDAEIAASSSAIQAQNNDINTRVYNDQIIRSKIAANDQNIQQRTKLQLEIESIQKSIEILQTDIKAINVCIKGMGDKGIKAHKFGTIIAILNEIIKDYIDVLTNGQVQVWFSPFREKANAKSADDVVAEIQIMVKEGPKEEIDVGMYSGAERQEITLAIICAFWQLAMMQNGGTNVLFLDEIFGMLSNARSDLVLALLDKLKQTHYGTIVVVTHSDYVKDQMQYDNVWTAEKRNHLSTLRSLK